MSSSPLPGLQNFQQSGLEPSPVQLQTNNWLLAHRLVKRSLGFIRRDPDGPKHKETIRTIQLKIDDNELIHILDTASMLPPGMMSFYTASFKYELRILHNLLLAIENLRRKQPQTLIRRSRGKHDGVPAHHDRNISVTISVFQEGKLILELWDVIHPDGTGRVLRIELESANCQSNSRMCSLLNSSPYMSSPYLLHTSSSTASEWGIRYLLWSMN